MDSRGYTALVPRRRILGAGFGWALVAGCATALAVAWWPAPKDIETSTVDVSGQPHSVRLTRPMWLRPGAAGTVTLESGAAQASNARGRATPEVLVARLSSADLIVSPGEEQAASFATAGAPWSFTWRVTAGETGDPTASLILSQRQYPEGGPIESVLWARNLSFALRRPGVPPGLSLLGLAAGAFLLFVALRRSE